MSHDQDLKDWLRLIEEDRTECTPPKAKDSLNKSTPPALLPTDLLRLKGWPQAAAWTWSRLAEIPGLERDDLASDYWSGEKKRCREACSMLAARLFNLGQGEAALCAQMLGIDAGIPLTFDSVLPQLAYCAEHLWPATSESEERMIKAKLATWWAAADGQFEGDDRSIFLIAHHEWVSAGMERTARDRFSAVAPRAEPATAKDTPSDEPTLMVMPKAKAAKLAGGNKEFEELIDARLPLIIARDLPQVRCTLMAEYPHAVSAIDLVLRDLREGQPVKWRPILVLGPAGSGKSRLVRRISELCGLSIYRIDGAGSTDAVNFAGTSKAWSNTVPCAPARAIYQARIGNPILLVDEADKAGTSQHNGRLANAILPFLEKETSARYRDASLDSELDLSWVNHIATANSVEDLPGPMKDRYRFVKVPSPRLVDLPVLAANVVREMASESGEEGFAQALAADELDVIGRAWSAAGFSIRKLQAIVSATLEARGQMAVRH